MAKRDEEYRSVVVESFRPTHTSGLHGAIHIRAVRGQGYPDDILVQCSKKLVGDYAVGTRFRIRAKLTDREGSRPFLYSRYSWAFEVLAENERALSTEKPKRDYKLSLPANIGREDILSAIAAYDIGIDHFFAQSTEYDLLHDGNRYPPKAIVGIAAGRILDEAFIPDDFSGGVGSECFRILNSNGFIIVTKSDFGLYPDEIGRKKHFEGSSRTVTVNRYERDPTARSKCIQHYDAVCLVCNFDFGKTYGPLGEGFIHVHHIVPISRIGTKYEVDPIEDLRPVCPNCHAMLHKTTPPFSIEQLKSVMGLK